MGVKGIGRDGNGEGRKGKRREREERGGERNKNLPPLRIGLVTGLLAR